MKKNAKRIIALIALTAIIVLIAAFAVSAFTTAPGESGNRFMALLSCIIAIPILAWLLLFCVGRLQNRHTIAEFFPEQDDDTPKKDIKK